MAQNFTEAVQTALEDAFRIAQERNNTEVTENHLLLSFLEDPSGYFTSILQNLGTDPTKLGEEDLRNLEKLATFSGGQQQPPSAGRSLQSRIADAQSIAKSWNDTFTG